MNDKTAAKNEATAALVKLAILESIFLCAVVGLYFASGQSISTLISGIVSVVGVSSYFFWRWYQKYADVMK